MIPRVQTGRSFKGAGLYYLHDKRADGEAVRFTAERVAWTHALNTMEEEPDEVLAEMRKTAFDQPMLKMMSGNRIDGRPTKDPVMTVALSWSPEQQPTKAQMIEAGKSYLDHMGWSELQTLMVAHSDTAHPHLHLIINRIHPETGMTQDKAWVKHRSQEWALAYEREQGQVLCIAREAKYSQGLNVGPDGSMTRAELAAWQRAGRQTFGQDRPPAEATPAAEWAALKDEQRAVRVAFWKETGQQRRELRSEIGRQVKSEFAGKWSDYAAYRDERQQAAKRYDAEARRALRHMRKLHSIDGVAAIKERQAAYHDQLKADLATHRQPIAAAQAARMEAAGQAAQTQLGEERAAAYTALLAAQREERTVLRQDQAGSGTASHRADGRQAVPAATNGPTSGQPIGNAPATESRPVLAGEPLPGHRPPQTNPYSWEESRSSKDHRAAHNPSRGRRDDEAANPYARDFGDDRDPSPDR